MKYLSRSWQLVNIIIQTLIRAIDPWLIILFGSYAKGRIQEEYQGDPKNLENFTKQDSIILNIQLVKRQLT